ncbi:ABC transporter ATP-binding protein [Rhizocola hellebori]|uniref:ABC transporter ATP-binding protein n=1 Tax=Rhizocola hellebori TaxID=1392758 RepID=A0A8J3QHN5_9ACTN|nr:urea ABC transporter ATP-binding subunit UrtE [Rhizocola hellebori]GIH09593.1 ABC transporter ATP-binding protein [Rhizocola hellebori]
MLTIEGLQAGYGRSIVLHGIGISVGAAGVTAVLGHNGAGKSTLLRAAIGLLKPRQGTISFDGEDITRMPAHQRVAAGMAYVPQGQQCFPHLTALENLQITADGRKQGKESLDAALDLFPALKPLLRRRAGLLSGGQRQQLGIARALITRPRLLLLDEPTEGIQPSVVAEIEEKILDLANHVAIFLVEQHLGFALRAAQNYYVLESGRVTSTGSGGESSADLVRAALSV